MTELIGPLAPGLGCACPKSLRGSISWYMIQAVYKGVEIEMELHQQAHDYWKCDYTLIKHPGRAQTIHHGDIQFPTMDLAKEHALQEARNAIDGAPADSANKT